MTLHPHLTRSELVNYCLLCHENGVKTVRVDKKTSEAIKRFILHGTPMKYLGIKFKIADEKIPSPPF